MYIGKQLLSLSKKPLTLISIAVLFASATYAQQDDTSVISNTEFPSVINGPIICNNFPLCEKEGYSSELSPSDEKIIL
jgi:hypothetical protein